MHFHIASNYFEGKYKLMFVVDKEFDKSKIIDEYSKKHPNESEGEYLIETKKEDITLYYKLEKEKDFYYKENQIDEKGKVIKYKGDYNRERKGDISKIIKNQILYNEKPLTRDDFYDFNEIEGWFEKFKERKDYNNSEKKSTYKVKNYSIESKEGLLL